MELRSKICREKAKLDWAQVEIYVSHKNRRTQDFSRHELICPQPQMQSSTANVIEANSRITIVDQIGMLGRPK